MGVHVVVAIAWCLALYAAAAQDLCDTRPVSGSVVITGDCTWQRPANTSQLTHIQASTSGQLFHTVTLHESQDIPTSPTGKPG